MFGTRKLGRTSSQRKAMLRAMTTYLFENGKMETTFTRAKEVQPVAEKMITLGKKGDLAAYVRPLSDPKFLICVVVLAVDLLITATLTGQVRVTWSAFVMIPCGIISAMLWLVHRNRALRSELKRKLHL